MGNRIDPLLHLKTKIIAIEPQKKCWHFLERKFGDKITIVPMGLGEEEGEKIFYISNTSVLSSFSKEWIDAVEESKRFERYNVNWGKTERMKMTTLDALIRKYGIPQFIKIDVEGYELEVLKGLSIPINVISFEYTVPEQTEKLISCIRQIERINEDILFNYSIGESMELDMLEWITAEKIINHIYSEEFQNTYFGDIYVCRKNHIKS
jgi:FkbM family methyltransferase